MSLRSAEIIHSYPNLGLMTADQAPAPDRRLKHALGTAGARERMDPLSPSQRQVFETLRPAAVALIATDGTQFLRQRNPDGVIVEWGGNRGFWPARWALTTSYKDNLTASWDRDPAKFNGVQFRLWSLTEPERDKLHDALTGYLKHLSDAAEGIATLRHGFVDLGPEAQMTGILEGAEDVAQRIGVSAWVDMAWHLGRGSRKDDDFRTFLDQVHTLAGTMRRPGQAIQRCYEMAALRILRR